MQAVQIYCVVFLILTLTTLSLALPKRKGHRHHRHHGFHKHHEKKSQTPSTNTTGSIGKMLSNILGIGTTMSQNIPAVFNPGKGVITKKNTTTKVNGNLTTTTTVSQHFEKDANNKSHLIGQSVQVVTTNTNGTNNMGKQKPAFFFDFKNPFNFALFGDEPKRECSDNKQCKKKGTYCDQERWECKPKAKLGEKCEQADQCKQGKGKHKAVCLWGECAVVSSAVGYSGVFCKKHSDCKSDELHCAPQGDVSQISNVCVPKPGDGQTCGRRTMFDFWPIGRSSRDLPCRKGLVCMDVGYSGRKICRSKSFLKDEAETDDI